MISKDEVKHIARLARLGLSGKETEKMQKELSLILDYIEKLKEVDILEVKLYSDLGKFENVTREDEINEKLKIKNKKLLDSAPEREGAYLKTKQIL